MHDMCKVTKIGVLNFDDKGLAPFSFYKNIREIREGLKARREFLILMCMCVWDGVRSYPAER